MPKITKCKNNHYYDAERYDQCPYCTDAQPAAPQGGGGMETVAVGGFSPAAAPSPAGATVPVTPINPVVSGQTVPITPPPVQPAGATIPVAPPAGNNAFPDGQKTVAKFSTNGNAKEPVVGWLVSIEGKHRGEDFRLKVGNNFIGRDRSMDVVLANDNTVSRNKHCILTYDPIGGIFIVRAGESHELTYLNGGLLLEPKVLNIYDKITVGSSVLMFVPLCGESFKWDEQKN